MKEKIQKRLKTLYKNINTYKDVNKPLYIEYVHRYDELERLYKELYGEIFKPENFVL